MDLLTKLSKYFSQFPGIGERQSRRFVYFLFTRKPSYLDELSLAITEIKNNISQCKSCYRFFQSNEDDNCDVCTNPNTDTSTLLVVEKDADFENIKRTAIYNGKYFILGGLIPIVEKGIENKVKINELMKEIEGGKYAEVILALPLNPQGEHTDMYIRKILSPVQDKYSFTISTLGRGLSTGTELEYSDSSTIQHALQSRFTS